MFAFLGGIASHPREVREKFEGGEEGAPEKLRPGPHMRALLPGMGPGGQSRSAPHTPYSAVREDRSGRS